MTKVQRIRSVNSRQYRVLLAAGILFFMALGVMSSKEIFSKRYVDGTQTIVALAFFGFAGFSLNYLFNRKEFTISESKVIVKNRFWKRTYLNHQIHGFFIDRGKNKDATSSDKLVFKTITGFVIIDSSQYSNFYSLRAFTKENYKELDETQFRGYRVMKTLPMRITFLCGAIFLLVFSIDKYFEDVDRLEEDFVYVSATLANSPSIENSGGSSNRKYIQIFTEEFPEFEFKINGFRYRASNTNAIRNLQSGDRIRIAIMADEFNGKIDKSKSPSFKMKHFHWEMIWIYQLDFENEKYIDWALAKRLMENDKKWSWLMLLFGMIMFSMVFIAGKEE